MSLLCPPSTKPGAHEPGGTDNMNTPAPTPAGSGGHSPQLVQLNDDPNVVVGQVHVVQHEGHEAILPLG